MKILIVIIIIVCIVWYRKKKQNESPSKPEPVNVGDSSQYPDTLGELRKMRDKTRKQEVEAGCRRKICEVGIQLYHEGKLVASPGEENDVGTLLEEMVKWIDDCHTYNYLTPDEAFELRCLEEGEAMISDFNERAKKDSSVNFPFPVEFSQYSWKHLADFYTEGKVCPRNPGEARKYRRMYITYQQRTEQDISYQPIEDLMEIPAPGEDGIQEIFKWIALKYGLGAIRIKKGLTHGNCFPQVLQQGAELLAQMNWDVLGSADISAMLEEYERAAAAGNAYAQFRLGSFYVKGRYVRKDEEKGLALLLKSAEQNLYMGVHAVSDYYHSKTFWYNVEALGLSKQQVKEYEALYDKWSKRSDQVLAEVERAYANSFTGYLQNSANVPTRGAAKAPETVSAPETEERDDVYRGRLGETDEESVFSVLDLPDVMTGPHGVTYRKTSVSTYSADYWGDDGSSTTIHVSDLGATGTNAKNSDGYFHW